MTRSALRECFEAGRIVGVISPVNSGQDEGFGGSTPDGNTTGSFETASRVAKQTSAMTSPISIVRAPSPHYEVIDSYLRRRQQ